MGWIDGEVTVNPAAMGHSTGATAVAQALALRPDLFRAAVLEDHAREGGVSHLARRRVP